MRAFWVLTAWLLAAGCKETLADVEQNLNNAGRDFRESEPVRAVDSSLNKLHREVTGPSPTLEPTSSAAAPGAGPSSLAPPAP
jgi:hypothetical protein